MDSEASFNEKELVLPGDRLSGDDLKAGMGTYRKDGGIYAAQVGRPSERSGYMNVVPLGGKYMPRQGDSVIGVVKDVTPTGWFVDINSPYPALLHVNEVPWRVDYGDTQKHLGEGNVLLAKIKNVDEIYRVQLTIKEHGLRKLDEGRVEKIPYTRVPAVIGRGGSVISMLKRETDTNMFVGQNGRVWMQGDMEDVMLLSEALALIGDTGAGDTAALLEVFFADGGRAGPNETVSESEKEDYNE